MTHDKLRDYIDDFDCAGMVYEPPIKALRAVVELHKPFTEFGDASCEECFNADYSHKEQPYPCGTIQAIEGQLG